MASRRGACRAAQAHPPIKLKKPQHLRLDKMAAKAMGGMGSAAKSARRMVSRKPTAEASLQHATGSASSCTVGGGGQEAEARLVYVSTHAEGVTRVCSLAPPSASVSRRWPMPTLSSNLFEPLYQKDILWRASFGVLQRGDARAAGKGAFRT